MIQSGNLVNVFDHLWHKFKKTVHCHGHLSTLYDSHFVHIYMCVCATPAWGVYCTCRLMFSFTFSNTPTHSCTYTPLGFIVWQQCVILSRCLRPWRSEEGMQLALVSGRLGAPAKQHKWLPEEETPRAHSRRNGQLGLRREWKSALFLWNKTQPGLRNHYG